LVAEEALLAELQTKRISLARAIVFAFVDLQFGPSLAVFAGYLIVTGGGGSWFSIVLAFFLILSVAEVVRIFSSRYVVTGGLMTYLVKTNSRRAGYFVGSANLLGYLGLAAAVSTGVTYFSQAVFLDLHWDGLTSQSTQIATFCVVGALSTAIALRGLQIASTIAIALGLLCIPFVVWITVQALFRSNDSQWGSLRPHFGNLALLFAPVPLVLSSYIGFDGWAFLAAETDRPQRNVPRILNSVVIGSSIIILIATLVQTPMLLNHATEIDDGQSPLSIMTHIAGLDWLATTLDIVLTLAIFGAGITALTYGGRLFAAAATVGLLPRAVARVSGGSKAPWVAIVCLGAAEIVLPTALSIIVHKTPIDAGIYFSESTAYLWAVPYVVSALAAARIVWRSPRRAHVSLVVAIFCAAGYTAFMVYSLRDGWSTADTALPWICLILIAALFAAMMVIEWRRGESVDLLALDAAE